SMVEGSMSGSSPCTLMTIRAPSAAATSATRSVPEAQSARVMRASAPCAVTASKMRSSSVATITRETDSARAARSTTCRIIGICLMGRRGLPGNLVEPYRAGMIATASPFTGLQSIRKPGQMSNDAARRLLLRRNDIDVAECHLAVIALEHQRAGRAFVAVERAAGDARYLGVVDDRLAVQH